MRKPAGKQKRLLAFVVVHLAVKVVDQYALQEFHGHAW
jgi:hypothetical protein